MAQMAFWLLFIIGCGAICHAGSSVLLHSKSLPMSYWFAVVSLVGMIAAGAKAEVVK